MSTSPTDDSRTQSEVRTYQRTTFAEGTVLAGRYRVQTLIGEGGMGDVYLATHLKIDKKVAVKLLAPEQMRRERTVVRFLQEAKAASKIRHPNIVDITDYGEAEGCAFFVMEYLEGEDLSQMLKRVGRIGWERAQRICTQLLEALGAAHKAGVIHRDIKPHNCFITPTDREPDFVKVIDFGIAKLREGTGEQLTRTGAIVGTAEYMSPEQGLGQELDGRSDLYSVGIILYRMLTGDVPFNAANPMGILYHHIHSPVKPPSEACPEAGIGPQIDALVLKALAKDRNERFASAEEFIAAIEAVDDPTGALAEPKRSQRPLVVGAAVVIGLAVASAVGWAFVGGSSEAVPDPSTPAVASAAKPEPAKAGVDAPKAEPAKAEPAKDEAANAEPPSEVDEAPDDEAADAEGADLEAQPESSAEPEEAVAGGAVPARRPARALRSALQRVAKRVSACGKKAGLFPGEKLTVAFTVAPSGKISDAQVIGSHSKAGAGCIVEAVKSAKLGPAERPQKGKHEFSI